MGRVRQLACPLMTQASSIAASLVGQAVTPSGARKKQGRMQSGHHCSWVVASTAPHSPDPAPKPRRPALRTQGNHGRARLPPAHTDDIIISSDEERHPASACAPPSASMQPTPSSSVGGAPSARTAGRALPGSLLSQARYCVYQCVRVFVYLCCQVHVWVRMCSCVRMYVCGCGHAFMCMGTGQDSRARTADGSAEGPSTSSALLKGQARKVWEAWGRWRTAGCDARVRCWVRCVPGTCCACWRASCKQEYSSMSYTFCAAVLAAVAMRPPEVM